MKEARKRAGMSQEELAKKLGRHQTCISAYEKGKWCPTAKYLLRLSKILDCPMEELLEGNEDESA